MDQRTTTPPSDIDAFLGVEPPSRRAKLIKWGAIALGVLIVLLLVWRFFFSGSDAVSYATTPVQRGNLEVSVSATGNLAPTTQVNVGVEQSGTIEDVLVNNNDRVTKGQVLARLDLSKLRDALAQARANYAQSVASIAQARALAQQDKATLDRYQEVAKLSGGKVPSATELDVARGTYARDVANVQAAVAAAAAAKAQVSTAETNVSKGVIYSPVNGIVLSRQVQPGQTVAASFNTPTLFTIAEDLSQMKLEVKVDEADVGEVREGQGARFTVDAYPNRTFPATVTRVDFGANATPQINSAGTTVTSSTTNVIAYTAALTVSNPDEVLKPGMTATADIVTAQKRDILVVPNAALRFNPNRGSGGSGSRQGGSGGSRSGLAGAMVPTMPGRRGGSSGAEKSASIGRGSSQAVFVVGEEGKPKRVRVKVGSTNGSLTEVVGGELKAGDKVITGKLSSDTDS